MTFYGDLECFVITDNVRLIRQILQREIKIIELELTSMLIGQTLPVHVKLNTAIYQMELKNNSNR